MPTLGIAIITKNAARHLPACLAAIDWADQIVVLDSGSSDNTEAIALSAQAQFVQNTDWQGFGQQKNRAIALLNTDWILSIDADEVLSPELEKAIRAAIQNPASDVYLLNRLSNYCGRWMRHSGWHPDWLPRLFRRGCAQYSADLVHERLIYSAKPAMLDGLLMHHSFDNLEMVLDKVNRYSSAGAEQRHSRGEKSSLLKAIYKACWAFLRTYLLQRGFLDGREGFILAVSNAEGTYYRYLKLMYLNHQ